MKRLDIITRPENLDTVKKILAGNEYSGMTVTAAMGCGHQRGVLEEFKELNLNMNLLPKINIMTVVLDEDVEELLTQLQEQLTTGSVGDGKIFLSDVLDVVRIRTGERGEDTL
ncbi:MAG: P-II family nitrogen regulator [Oscillospiraceae bacterium]|jgi:nitrogen regulatory protein P-II 1|nr:P-II family nitrogen regulator [Oscillospiraceae bacterium]